MKHPFRVSTLFLAGILAVGSTALGYYYYFVYEPPLETAESFLTALEKQDTETLKKLVLVTLDRDSTKTRPAKEEEIRGLLEKPFQRGRVLDQDKRDGASGAYNFLIYRVPDGTIFALLLTKQGDSYKVVIPERPRDPELPYLWDYAWTN
jgi:hypothetical protein